MNRFPQFPQSAWLSTQARCSMPVGVTGRQTNMAFARSSTWGVPASVTQQMLAKTTAGMDDVPELVEDDAFTLDYIAAAEIGDRKVLTPNLDMQLRYEQGCDVFLAAAIGSPAAPSSLSAGANSVVAYAHVIDMAPDLWAFFTIATDMVNYVQEVRTLKPSGFTIKVGANGRLEIAFQTVADRSTYDSTTNTNSTVAGATPATPGNRAFRKFTRLRMNLQSGNSLTTTDICSFARDFTLTSARPMAQDFVLNRDTIIEPDDDGFFNGEFDINFARMTTAAANSFVAGFAIGDVFKADLLMLGTYINSTTQRSMLFELPALQVFGYDAVDASHGEIRPVVKFKIRLADAAPAGMASLTNPMRLTITNARSTNLLA